MVHAFNILLKITNISELDDDFLTALTEYVNSDD